VLAGFFVFCRLMGLLLSCVAPAASTERRIMRIVLFVVISFISLISLTPSHPVFVQKTGCKTLVHTGALTEWQELGGDDTACIWTTKQELKLLLIKGHHKMVVVGHGRASGNDTIIGGEVTYDMLRFAARKIGKKIAAFSCRSDFFFSEKVISETPFEENGILVWVKQGQTLLGDPTWAWQQAYAH
jgi:hypothetical protein